MTRTPREAAEFALTLFEMSRKLNWKKAGFDAGVTFRVGLHAGPAFVTDEDPLTRRPNAYGLEVSRAARIEPIVEPGEVWASRAFVILAMATGCEGLRFHDLGERPLAKGARPMYLYRVGRA